MKIKQITESAGGTTSGAIASVASPIGVPQKRTGSLFKGKKTKKKFYEGKMKDLAYDIQHLDAGNFMKKYGHPKDYFTKKLGKPPVSEAELSEQDLIVVPGMRKSKDSSFIPHEKDRRDHEVEMARSEVYAAAKDAMRIFKLLKDRTEDEGLMGWQQSYITLASDYLNSVADSMEYQGIKGEGVLAGGMSNFEESQLDELKKSTINDYLSKQSAAVRFGKEEKPKKVPSWKVAAGKVNPDSEMGKYAKIKAGDLQGVAEGGYYDPLDQERREQDAMDQERRDFKRSEMEYELRGEEEAERKANEGPWYVRIDGKLVRDKNKDPYVFNTLEAARKAAQTMMKKDWNKGKQFSMTRSTTEGMSAAVKLQRAFDREKAASDASRNRGKEELEKARKEYDKKQADGKNKKDVTEEKCNECGGVAYADESIAEEKDACYNKVKSRYKVWPSAYASGALSKCRKVGASNWGNKSKK